MGHYLSDTRFEHDVARTTHRRYATAIPTDDWTHNLDSRLARRRHAALAADCGSSGLKRWNVNLRLNTEEQIGRVDSEQLDLSVTRDP